MGKIAASTTTQLDTVSRLGLHFDRGGSHFGVPVRVVAGRLVTGILAFYLCVIRRRTRRARGATIEKARRPSYDWAMMCIAIAGVLVALATFAQGLLPK